MSNTRDLGHGMVVEALDGGAITVFRGQKYSRDGVDVWAQAVINDIQGDHKNIAHLHDMRNAPVVITPYVRKKLQDVGENRDNEGYVAIVMTPNPLTNIVRFFAQRDFKKDQPRVEIQLFFDYDEALVWLRQMVNQPK
ncbi:MAG: hypothetical protein L0154_27915, partial [Chloroflexi bacterium]|nr:hypothetical protein [Chloroflexota bacterium]